MAEQQQLLRTHDADEPGEQPRGATVGTEPTLHEGLPEAARLAGNREVGCERDLTPEPRGPAPHRAHHRELHLEQQLDQPVRLQRCAPLDAARAWPCAVAHVARHPVGARAEVVTGAAHDDRTQPLRGRGVFQRFDDAQHRVGIERVLTRRAVEHDVQHAILLVHPDAVGVRVVHARYL